MILESRSSVPYINQIEFLLGMQLTKGAPDTLKQPFSNWLRADLAACNREHEKARVMLLKCRHWAGYLSVLHPAVAPHRIWFLQITSKAFSIWLHSPSSHATGPILHPRLASPNFYACQSFGSVCKGRLVFVTPAYILISVTLPFPSRQGISADEADCKNCVFNFNV